MLRPALITLLALLMPAFAAAKCLEASPSCAPIGEWQVQLAVGVGARTNPLADSSDIPLVLIPQVSYYGQRFFLDNLELGFTLVDRPRAMLNLIATPGSDGLYFFRSKLNRFVLDGGLLSNTNNSPIPPPKALDSEVDTPVRGGELEVSENIEQPRSGAFSELSKRRLGLMAGLEASVYWGGEWQLQILQDAMGLHDGQEVRLAYGARTQVNGHDWGLTLGANWKSDRLLHYYYGVAPDEAHVTRPAYNPGSGVSPFIRLGWSKPVSDHWRWFSSLQYEHLSSAVRSSPLVEDDQVLQVFFGGVYHF